GGQKPWGILEAQTRRGRSFDEDDFHFLQSVANVISTAHARKQAESEREHLATFVEHNPNPVVELDAGANVIYSNDAARITTGALHKHHPGELLPARLAEIVKRCLTEGVDARNEPAEIDK